MKALFCFVCNAILSLIAIGQRLVAWLVTFSYEIELSDKRKAMACVTDPQVLAVMRASYDLVMRDAEEANQRYNALLPVGQRHTLHVPV